jgi:hypothetical protein
MNVLKETEFRIQEILERRHKKEKAKKERLKSKGKTIREKPKLKRKKTKEEVDSMFKRLSKSKQGNVLGEPGINNRFLRSKSREKYFKRKKYLNQKEERETRRKNKEAQRLSNELIEFDKIPSEK